MALPVARRDSGHSHAVLSPTTGRRLGKTLLPLGCLALLFLIELLAILRLNSGHFTYTLDDPYIHLALAQRIHGGHYGINPGEPAAPSSSILWPFLLAPFATAPWFEFLPLILGLVAAGATVLVYRNVLTLSLEAYRPRPVVVAASVSALILLTNLVGLPFTGMEHTVQVLLTACAVLGLVREAATGRVPWWLVPVVALGPMIRYENLAVSSAAILYLLFRGHRRTALVAALATMVPLGIFSLFLSHEGLRLLPSSVLLASRSPSVNLMTTLRDPTGVLLAVAVVWMIGIAVFSSRGTADRTLAGSMGIAVALHLLGGRYGAYHRWEMYIVATAALSLVYLERDPIGRAIARRRSLIVVLFVALWSVVLGGRYLFGLSTIPVASNNIYEQQYQMHRFVLEQERRPVAVNDLGYVAFGNTSYVLDLLGLGSPGALAEPEGPRRLAWLEKATRERSIETVMLYREWFEELPPSWVKVGELRLTRPRITPAWPDVSFYATSDTVYHRVRERVAVFQEKLPPGVRFEFTP